MQSYINQVDGENKNQGNEWKAVATCPCATQCAKFGCIFFTHQVHQETILYAPSLQTQMRGKDS